MQAATAGEMGSQTEGLAASEREQRFQGRAARIAAAAAEAAEDGAAAATAERRSAARALRGARRGGVFIFR